MVLYGLIQYMVQFDFLFEVYRNEWKKLKVFPGKSHWRKRNRVVTALRNWVIWAHFEDVLTRSRI